MLSLEVFELSFGWKALVSARGFVSPMGSGSELSSFTFFRHFGVFLLFNLFVFEDEVPVVQAFPTIAWLFLFRVSASICQ